MLINEILKKKQPQSEKQDKISKTDWKYLIFGQMHSFCYK